MKFMLLLLVTVDSNYLSMIYKTSYIVLGPVIIAMQGHVFIEVFLSTISGSAMYSGDHYYFAPCTQTSNWPIDALRTSS